MTPISFIARPLLQMDHRTNQKSVKTDFVYWRLTNWLFYTKINKEWIEIMGCCRNYLLLWKTEKAYVVCREYVQESVEKNDK